MATHLRRIFCGLAGAPGRSRHRPAPFSRRLRTAIVWLLSLLPALACRYSVRDTGFVDLGTAPYELVLRADGLLPDDILRHYRQTAAATFLDANIAFSIAAAPAGGSSAALVLSDPDRRSLVIAAGDALPRTLPDIVDLLERVALSPARIRIHDQLLRAYAVLVLVEGKDTAGNQRVLRLLEEAATAIQRLMPSMPKPVEVPPAIVSLSVAQAAAESVLLWGLGMEPVPTEDPRIAIVFGRGRRIGDFIEGPVVSRTLIQDRLAIIGQDCECELDRSWLQGPVFPARWDAARQSAATAALGFDPENPLIRSEVSQIVLRGALNPGRKRPLSGAFDALTLGYVEETLEPHAEVGATATPPTDHLASPAAASATPISPPSASSAPAASVEPSASPQAGVSSQTPSATSPRPESSTVPWRVAAALATVMTIAGVVLLVRSRRDPS